MSDEKKKQNKIGFAAVPATLVAALVLALHNFEGREYTTYWDKLGQVWTVCAGVTGKGVIPGRTYTRQECDALEQAYVTKMLARMGNCVKGEYEFNVIKGMGHFAYNIGEDKFCGSTAAKLLNQGYVEAACKQIPRWTFVKGRDCRIVSSKCPGIVRRRTWEEATCLGR